MRLHSAVLVMCVCVCVFTFNRGKKASSSKINAHDKAVMPSACTYAAYCRQMMHAKFHRWITDIGKEKVVAFVGYEGGSNYHT